MHTCTCDWCRADWCRPKGNELSRYGQNHCLSRLRGGLQDPLLFHYARLVFRLCILLECAFRVMAMLVIYAILLSITRVYSPCSRCPEPLALGKEATCSASQSKKRRLVGRVGEHPITLNCIKLENINTCHIQLVVIV